MMTFNIVVFTVTIILLVANTNRMENVLKEHGLKNSLTIHNILWAANFLSMYNLIDIFAGSNP